MAQNRTVYAVVYVGAPYGDNEAGEIVSRHRTYDAAVAARTKLQDNPRYYGSNSTIRRVTGGVIEHDAHGAIGR